MSRKGVAASTLWSKCLVSSTFSLWFTHLPAFIQASQSPQCAMRAAYAVLKKMQDYRLHTPDEVTSFIINIITLFMKLYRCFYLLVVIAFAINITSACMLKPKLFLNITAGFFCNVVTFCYQIKPKTIEKIIKIQFIMDFKRSEININVNCC